jgi:hypothetical protein
MRSLTGGEHIRHAERDPIPEGVLWGYSDNGGLWDRVGPLRRSQPSAARARRAVSSRNRLGEGGQHFPVRRPRLGHDLGVGNLDSGDPEPGEGE